jgi:hypothetical protein
MEYLGVRLPFQVKQTPSLKWKIGSAEGTIQERGKTPPMILTRTLSGCKQPCLKWKSQVFQTTDTAYLKT